MYTLGIPTLCTPWVYLPYVHTRVYLPYVHTLVHTPYVHTLVYTPYVHPGYTLRYEAHRALLSPVLRGKMRRIEPSFLPF